MFHKTFPLDQFQNALQNLTELDGFVWLDSAGLDKHSILAMLPTRSFTFTQASSRKDFLEFFHELPSPLDKKTNHLPFSGGWVGYFSFESYPGFDNIPLTPSLYPSYPLGQFHHYDSFIWIDHSEPDQVHLFSKSQERFDLLNEAIKNPNPVSNNDRFHFQHVSDSVDFNEYNASFEKIQSSLRDGHFFELNFTFQQYFKILSSGSFLDLYFKLRETCPAPMMAYLDFGALKVLSASPELFFEIDSGKILTKPIKGTAERALEKPLDEKRKQDLLKSSKDKSELLMITDLLRNDLGRICKSGTVETETLFQLETFSHYHHLMSKISGALSHDTSFYDVFNSLFPGGSITGAPKIQVIQETTDLEKNPRGIYTGAIGYFSDCGRAQFNIPIRTITAFDNMLTLSTGSGITVKSKALDEYEECLVKLSGIYEALGLQKNHEIKNVS